MIPFRFGRFSFWRETMRPTDRPTDGIKHQTGQTYQVKDDFCEFFISRASEGEGGNGSSASAGGAPPTVTLEGFREYYRDVGVCEPYDSVFVPMMEVGRRRRKGDGAKHPDAGRGAGSLGWGLGAWNVSFENLRCNGSKLYDGQVPFLRSKGDRRPTTNKGYVVSCRRV